MIDLSGIHQLRVRLDRVAAPDAGPLMVSLMKIIAEDNRRGVLAGLDKDGVALEKVTYRPLGRARAATPEQRNNANARLRWRPYAGTGTHAAGLHNNLTRQEYERLGGPPLAPRGASSRVITNFKTGYQRDSAAVWDAYGYWDQVVSTKGVGFLDAHFTGATTGRGGRTRLPRRDLRGVRPEGMALARKASINWMRDLIRRMT